MSQSDPYPVPPDPELENPFLDSRPNGSATPTEAAATPAAQPKRGRKNRNAYVSTAAKAGVTESKEKQILFPVKKPGSINFFRVCTDLDSRLNNVFVIDGGMEGFSIVAASVVDISREVRKRVKEATLVTCVNHNGKYFVWPILLSNPKTANAAFKVVEMAESQWIRISWDNFSQSYSPELPNPEDFPELAANPDPVWSPSGSEILDEAFGDSIDDPGSLTLKKALKNSK